MYDYAQSAWVRKRGNGCEEKCGCEYIGEGARGDVTDEKSICKEGKVYMCACAYAQ